MPSFSRGGTAISPFGKNVYLRSTSDCSFESYTVAKNSVPYEVINGTNQRILQPGTAMAKITSGPDAGKVGPFQAAGTAEVQTITPSGTWTGGTYTLTYNGQTTAAIAYNANAAAITAALAALSNVTAAGGSITVTGGPLSTGAAVATFGGNLQGDQPMITISVTNVTGTTPGATVAETTKGVAGAIDGRQTVANLVGLNDTFLPWQLLERDVEIACLYDGTAVQAWCYELDINGARVALTNTTRNGMVGQVSMDILFK